MGDSLQPRKNPFMAQGLIPGVRLRLDVTVGDQQESHVTAVEDVSSSDIAILTPMKQLRSRAFAAGTLVHASYIHDRKRFRFVSEFTGISSDGAVSHLRLPATIEVIERRSSFRLQTAIRPLAIYRLVIDGQNLPEDPSNQIEATVADISEGGLCLTTRQPVRTGERLGFHAALPEAGEIRARLRVTDVDEPAKGNLTRRVHCQFTDISLADCDRIARYLMRRQLELRRRGQL